jgi:hypothetical protein
MMAADLLVLNVRPLGGDLEDILISAGRIARGPAPPGVPVLDGGGYIALPGMARREALADVVDINLVAFPQSGLLVRPGTVELLERALQLGAETVGGLDPCAIDRDRRAISTRRLFRRQIRARRGYPFA